MEENRFNETEMDEIEVYEMEPEEGSKKSGVGGLVLGVGALALGAVAAFVYKNRNKIEERRIAKLEKKGYVVTKLDPVDAEFEDVDPEEYSE